MVPFPDEVWHQIFSNLIYTLLEDRWWIYGAQADYSAQKTLVSISLACRRFHGLARPLLYRAVALEGGDGETEWHQDHFTRTLAACPGLGLQTRAVNLSDDALPRSTGFHWMLQELLPSLDLPPALRRHMELKLEDSKQNSCGDGDIGVAVFILAMMPQVRLVDLTYHSSRALIWMLSGRADMDERNISRPRAKDANGPDPPALSAAWRKAAAESALAGGKRGKSFNNYGLPHLEELRLRAGDRRRGTTPIDAIEAVLLHPNLRVLRLLGISWLLRRAERVPTPRWPDEPCGVEVLELRESLVDAAGLRHILARFPRLRTLSIHLGDGGDVLAAARAAGRQWEVRMDEFGGALRELGAGLTGLDLHTGAFPEFEVGAGDYVPCVVSLTGMRSLRRVSLLFEHLVGEYELGREEEEVPVLAEGLPPSLETLHLHSDQWRSDTEKYRVICGWVNCAVRRLLEDRDMPNLRQVSMERCYNETLDGEFDGPLTGWDMAVENRHLWKTCNGPGWMRTFVTFTRRG